MMGLHGKKRAYSKQQVSQAASQQANNKRQQFIHIMSLSNVVHSFIVKRWHLLLPLYSTLCCSTVAKAKSNIIGTSIYICDERVSLGAYPPPSMAFIIPHWVFIYRQLYRTLCLYLFLGRLLLLYSSVLNIDELWYAFCSLQLIDARSSSSSNIVVK